MSSTEMKSYLSLTPISAILNTAVTRNTARTMHKIVMRFCRLRTLAEIGIRLR